MRLRPPTTHGGRSGDSFKAAVCGLSGLLAVQVWFANLEGATASQAPRTCGHGCNDGHRTTVLAVGFSTPTGIDIDSHGHVFVADDGSRLRELSSRGKLMKTWGGAGAAPGQLDDPNLVALDNQGNLYVSDTRNDRIQKLSADGRLAPWGAAGTGLSSLNHPLGIAVGGDRVYVADSFDNRIVVLSLSGRPVAQWGVGVLHHPAGLALDARGDLFAPTPVTISSGSSPATDG